LQVEIDRSLYLATDLRQPGPGLARVRDAVAHLVRTLAEDMLRADRDPGLAIAAE
jgi:N-formylglutamate amidohydrolase